MHPLNEANDWVWWRDGVLYQVYPRSFADSDGDGVGDLRGITSRLDYLEWLGVDGVWLNPTFPSPDEDWGFDVSDYRSVHPDLGTLDDLDELLARVHELGMHVLLDLVPNHTSRRHPWFQASRAARDDGGRDFYVWRDPKADGSPPNNWQSLCGGPAWELDEARGQYYLHNFFAWMPDLNWWNPGVRDEFDDILRFWFDRGVAGFRIDVAHGIVKDRELRDNPVATPDDHRDWRRLGQRPEYSLNRPEAHDVLKRWRTLCDRYDEPRVLVGETWVYDLERLASFYGTDGDELHLAFNVVFMMARFDAAHLASTVARTEALIPPDAWPMWTLSNHDLSRYPTRWAQGDPRRVRCALMLLLTLRGTPVLYYGDELGMPDTDVAAERRRDPPAWPGPGRDRARTPMPWSAATGGGFTTPEARPWLPFGDLAAVNVGDQRDDPDSVLRLCRDLITLRRRDDDLRTGAYRQLEAPDGAWAFGRGARATIVLNLSDASIRVTGPEGAIQVGTNRARDGERVAGMLPLQPWEGAVILLDCQRTAPGSAPPASSARAGGGGLPPRPNGPIFFHSESAFGGTTSQISTPTALSSRPLASPGRSP